MSYRVHKMITLQKDQMLKQQYFCTTTSSEKTIEAMIEGQ